jgi:hypothetical protein
MEFVIGIGMVDSERCCLQVDIGVGIGVVDSEGSQQMDTSVG